MRRYPLNALLEATGLSESELSRKVGLDGTTLKRARERGFVEAAADRYATRAGLHATNVWPDWAEVASVECAERSCTNRFVPVRKSHRFCDPRCGRREWMRKRYQTDARLREYKRAASAAYYAECREYVRARQNAAAARRRQRDQAREAA